MPRQPEAIPVHYTDTGAADNAPVLLLHGGGSSSATWVQLTAELTRRGRRVIAPDLRGHGASPRNADYRLVSYHADIVRLLAELGLGTVDVVGHSLGGYLALSLAQQDPSRVRRLIAEEPAIPSRNGARRRRYGLVIRMTLGGLRHRRFDPAAVWSVIAELDHPGGAWWDRLPDISASALLIRGGPRSHLDQDDLAAVSRLIPQCREITIPVGHRVHSLAPGVFIEAVVAFLSSAGEEPGGQPPMTPGSLPASAERTESQKES
jgi:pimeloyl-ACP methyl ester carboxylesterase